MSVMLLDSYFVLLSHAGPMEVIGGLLYDSPARVLTVPHHTPYLLSGRWPFDLWRVIRHLYTEVLYILFIFSLGTFSFLFPSLLVALVYLVSFVSRTGTGGCWSGLCYL